MSIYHRSLLGELSRVAARTVTAFIRATVGERDLSVGMVSSIQTHGNPIALGRLAYQEHDHSVTYHSDQPAGPTAGAETTDVLEFRARVVSHIPDQGQVLQRYYGWYASRVRGRRRQGLDADSERPLVCVEPLPEAVHGARRRWAEVLRRIFEVEPLACPRCGQEMRLMAFITDPKVIDAILAHLERTAHTGSRSRAPPGRWRTTPASAPA